MKPDRPRGAEISFTALTRKLPGTRAGAFLRLLLFAIWLLPVFSTLMPQGISAALSTTCTDATLHYHRRNADYEGWGLHVWGPTSQTGVTWEAPLAPAGKDDFGIFWLVGMQEGGEFLNYIVHRDNEKDPGPDQQLQFAATGCEIWLVQGQETQYISPESALVSFEVQLTAAPRPTDHQILIHYRRSQADYDGWGLHVWGPTAEEGVTWTEPLMPEGQDDFGIYWLVDMQAGAEVLNYIVHKGDEKDPGPDQALDIPGVGREIWLVQASGEQFTDPEKAKEALLAAGVGDIKNKAQAYWLTRDTLAWPIEYGEKAIFRLHYDREGAIQVTQRGLVGGQTYTLEFASSDLSPALAEKYPHLKTAVMLRLPAGALAQVKEILKGQTAVSVSDPDGGILTATGLQTAGVLDELYANDEALGVHIIHGKPVLQVWAPTARNVTLHLYPTSDPAAQATRVPMNYNPDTGVWQAHGESDWIGRYYLYEVEVFVRQEGRVVANLVTDPYSTSLAMNSTRSQIVNLDDSALLPAGWENLVKPALDAPEDIVLYELHIRDFSVFEPDIPEQERGTYLAFTHPDSHGMRHLRRLAEAGLTHVHLLPAFDVATINENKTEWKSPDYAALTKLPPDSAEQQAVMEEIRGRDGYNWGYDPFHYSTPEGSYSTQPDGSTRIREFRAMVQALNQTGVRVVMDVVYNHTHASGQSDKSVLDRIVPGYYHRLDANGNVTTSTCCANTASEHAMMEKLMIDSLLVWSRDYKVDGFRFDLMGHHMLANMQHIRQALNSLTLAQDGVDGRSIYIYGEGWDFGEVAGGARGENATQLNLAGTGIGTFNDRVRDAVRGGNAFGGLQEQGFITGLYTDPNSVTNLPEKSQHARLLEISDWIRVCLAGNLADYELVNMEGLKVTGAQVGYNGSPAGYARDPQENIVYISAHDNETLFDAVQYKAPLEASLEQRVRIQNLGLSLVSLSQGIPFFHAGSELLRSKSLDRDSYDSGDWFNRLDYTYQTNNWGVGLPPQDKNGANYAIMKPLLANPALKASTEHILATRDHFEEMLRIRKSSPLFRLRTADEIKQRVLFYNTGPEQIPGLIVMAITDQAGRDLDPDHELVVVLFNAGKEAVEYSLAVLQKPDLALHPILASSADPVVRTARFASDSKTFVIPGRTTAVFWGQGRLSDAPTPTNTGNAALLPWLTALLGTLMLVLGIWHQIRNSTPEIVNHH